MYYYSANKDTTKTEKNSMFPSTDTAFKAFLSARFCSAIWSHISDCDETFNYWEPVSFDNIPRFWSTVAFQKLLNVLIQEALVMLPKASYILRTLIATMDNSRNYLNIQF